MFPCPNHAGAVTRNERTNGGDYEAESVLRPGHHTPVDFVGLWREGGLIRAGVPSH